MKVIASLTLDNVGLYDQSGIYKLVMTVQIFTSEGDNFKVSSMLPFPNSPAEFSAAVKDYVISTVLSASKKQVNATDIFLTGDLVIDSNDQVAQLTSDIKAVQTNVSSLQDTAMPLIEKASPTP